MATRGEWTKYINTLHELALVEDDLRTESAVYLDSGTDPVESFAVRNLADRILFERFGWSPDD